MDMPIEFPHGLWIDRFPAYVGDRWISTANEFKVNSPGGQLSALVANCGAKEASEAADAAVSAFETWRKVTPTERSKVLRGWNDLIVKNKEEIARTISREMGKPISE